MNWATTAADLAFFAKELDSFLPGRVFDAHCHLYRNADFATGTALIRLAARQG